MTVLRRVLIAVGLAVAVLAGPVTAAHAAAPTAPFDCKEAPTPESPTTGLQGMLLPAPDEVPATGDPFAKDSDTTLLQQYGLAGTGWVTYDTGCSPTDGIMSGAYTSIANWLMFSARNGVAITAVVGDYALNPTWLSVLDPAMRSVTATLNDSVTKPWFPVLCLLAAALVLASVFRARIGAALTVLMFALIGSTLVALAVAYPVKVGASMDDVVSDGSITVVQAASGRTGTPTEDDKATPGRVLVADVYHSVVYDTWLKATLGSATSDTATKYGPRLFKAHALTYAEARTVENDPEGKGKDIIDAHKKAWTEAADKVKSNDPVAYEYLTGHHAEDRVGMAVVAAYTSLALIVYVFAAILMILAAYMIVRLVVMFLPLLGALMVLPSFHGLLRDTARLLASAVVNTLVFAAVGAVLVRLVNALLVSTLPLPLTGVLVLILVVLAWVSTRPVRSMTRLVTNYNPARDIAETPGKAAKRSRKIISRVAGVAAGSALGHYAAQRAAGGDDDPETPTERGGGAVDHARVG